MQFDNWSGRDINQLLLQFFFLGFQWGVLRLDGFDRQDASGHGLHQSIKLAIKIRDAPLHGRALSHGCISVEPSLFPICLHILNQHLRVVQLISQACHHCLLYFVQAISFVVAADAALCRSRTTNADSLPVVIVYRHAAAAVAAPGNSG
ncbi:hypothetical protein CFBP4996_18330 [Agrobacterium leguminum]|uniref:Uncharacterized protein n=1 Tax=Agrobacterium leguminum TaxID=2792015 RepID=A0A9X3HKQ1_9HYPH|nr:MULTISPECIES: hypothetical protein [Agrobacterium]MCZ7909347.1 hypothetical protein [Agrobacterium leguminum]WFS67980.1 hypothetical protein CFBP4996_18330 [Agrobacterium leguminum]